MMTFPLRICLKKGKNVYENSDDSQKGKIRFLGIRCQPVEYLIDVKKLKFDMPYLKNFSIVLLQ
jgi:hypothetical protein